MGGGDTGQQHTPHHALPAVPSPLLQPSHSLSSCCRVSVAAVLHVQMTNWDYYEAVKRFQRVLEVSGINAALKAAGCVAGDTVAIGDTGEFVYSDDQSEAATYGAWLEDMESRGKARQGVARWPTPRQ